MDFRYNTRQNIVILGVWQGRVIWVGLVILEFEIFVIWYNTMLVTVICKFFYQDSLHYITTWFWAKQTILHSKWTLLKSCCSFFSNLALLKTSYMTLKVRFLIQKKSLLKSHRTETFMVGDKKPSKIWYD